MIAAAVSIGARAAEPSPGRIPPVTGLVKLFGEREDDLAAAIGRGDAAALSRTLADDFELRTGARAANPVPRAEFIANAGKKRPSMQTVEQMAVHDLGNAAV